MTFLFTQFQFFFKSLDAPAFSLPRHNLSRQLPSEPLADLLSTRLVWVPRGGTVPPLHPLYDGPYAVRRRDPTPSLRSENENHLVAAGPPGWAAAGVAVAPGPGGVMGCQVWHP